MLQKIWRAFKSLFIKDLDTYIDMRYGSLLQAFNPEPYETYLEVIEELKEMHSQ